MRGLCKSSVGAKYMCSNCNDRAYQIYLLSKFRIIPVSSKDWSKQNSHACLTAQAPKPHLGPLSFEMRWALKSSIVKDGLL